MAGLLIFSCTSGMLLWICKKVEQLQANSVATRALKKLNLAEAFGRKSQLPKRRCRSE